MTPQEQEAIDRIEQLMEDWAVANMEMPKSDPYEHGVQVGKYHGLKQALDLIEEVHKETEAAESKQD